MECVYKKRLTTSREGDNVIVGCYWKYCQRYDGEDIMCGEKGAYCK